MKFPLVSIALATYNGEMFLSQQLDSILAQSYINLEIIICDDNSTDSTRDILNYYAQNDQRIQLFFNETTLGLVKNFEKALSLCSGEYIALSDQDDIWEKEKIESLIRHIGSASLIHSDAILIDATEVIFASSYSHYSHKILYKDIFSYLLGNNVTGCTSLFSRKLLKYALPFPEGIFVHDWWLALCAYKHEGIVYYDQALIRYRQHAHNQIGAADSRRIHPFETREKAFKKTVQFLQELLDIPFFSVHEKQFMTHLIEYYNDFFTKKFCFRSFIFHLRYFRYFNEGKPFLYQVMGLFLAYFGADIQRKLWKFSS
ncbi:MAG TPA: glycosyltransferase family 2 protein [Sulfuricurvum sp.]|nr:glycosyltransferase family 2 protein [Sulfuricurvum sp.]